MISQEECSQREKLIQFALDNKCEILVKLYSVMKCQIIHYPATCGICRLLHKK